MGDYTCATTHLSTFAIVAFPATAPTYPTLNNDHSHPGLIAVVGIAILVFLILVLLLLHFMYDERLSSADKRVRSKLRTQMNELIVVSASHDNLHVEGAFDAPEGTVVAPDAIELKTGNGQHHHGKSRKANIQEIFTEPLTSVYPHL